MAALLTLLDEIRRPRLCEKIDEVRRLRLCDVGHSFSEVMNGAALKRPLTGPVGLATRPWTLSPILGASCWTTTRRRRLGRHRGVGLLASRSFCRLLGQSPEARGAPTAAVATVVTARCLRARASLSAV